MIFFLRSLQFCCRLIFFAPASVALAFMYLGGWITQAIGKRTRLRTTVIENVKMIFPQSNADQIADKLIENVSYSIFELLCLPFFRKKHFQAIFKWEGTENIDRALKEGKGAIFLTLHAGNYEVVPAALADLGYKVNSVLRAAPDPVFAFLNRCRSHRGVNIINVSEQDMYKETLKVLGRNEIVGTLADTGALEGRHIFYEFLGRKVPVATGWLTLAQRSGAPVVPTLTKKQGRINTIMLFEPFTVTRDNREEAIKRASRIFEEFIKRNPEQWGIFLNSYETKRMIEGE